MVALESHQGSSQAWPRLGVWPQAAGSHVLGSPLGLGASEAASKPGSDNAALLAVAALPGTPGHSLRCVLHHLSAAASPRGTQRGWETLENLGSSACVLSRVLLLVTPRAVACQAPLSMEFSRQECSSRLPFPAPYQ